MLLSDTRSIVRVAWPLYLSMIAVSLGALVNTVALGRFGTSALAGFAVTVAVYFPATAAVSGAVRGVMPFVAEAARPGAEPADGGRGEPGALAAVVRDGTWLALLVGLLGALAVACVPVLARVTAVGSLGAFPWLMAAAVLVTAFGSMATSSLVALGRSALVLRAGLVGAACVAVLSWFLVARLGLAGAGVAILVAAVANAAITLHGLREHVPLTVGRVHFGHLWRLAGVGLPMAGTVLVKFAVLGVLAIAAARLSTTAAAAHAIATSLVSLAFTAAVAIGQAVVPLVGARTDRRGTVRAVLSGLAVAVGVLSAVCALVLVVDVVPLFTADPAVATAVRGLLPLVVLVLLADGVQAVLGFGLAGLKRTTPSLIVFALCYGVLAPAAVLITERGGLTGLWLALAGATVLVAAGQAVAFARNSANVRSPG